MTFMLIWILGALFSGAYFSHRGFKETGFTKCLAIGLYIAFLWPLFLACELAEWRDKFKRLYEDFYEETPEQKECLEILDGLIDGEDDELAESLRTVKDYIQAN